MKQMKQFKTQQKHKDLVTKKDKQNKIKRTNWREKAWKILKKKNNWKNCVVRQIFEKLPTRVLGGFPRGP